MLKSLVLLSFWKVWADYLRQVFLEVEGAWVGRMSPWLVEQERYSCPPGEVILKRDKRGGTGFLLAWWPLGSWGTQWPIVAGSWIQGQVSHLDECTHLFIIVFLKKKVRLWKKPALFNCQLTWMHQTRFIFCDLRPSDRSELWDPTISFSLSKIYRYRREDDREATFKLLTHNQYNSSTMGSFTTMATRQILLFGVPSRASLNFE